MRILDENNNEIQESDINYDIGYTKNEQIITKHVQAIPSQEEIFHYRLKTWYFTDGTTMDIKSENDPHVRIVDKNKGIFQYIDQGEGKTYYGGEVVRIIDHEAVEAVEEHDEYEEILRYIKYTEDELKVIEENDKIKENREAFISSGAERLDNIELNVDDLTLMIADIIGTE